MNTRKDLSKEDLEYTVLCAILYDIKITGKYLPIARELISRGLVEEFMVWKLTEDGQRILDEREKIKNSTRTN